MEANNPEHATATATPDETATYVVQMPLGEGKWQDIRVEVAKRSKTRTVLFAGLQKAGVEPQDALNKGLRCRVLNEDEAHEYGLKAKEPRAPEIELV